MNSKRLCYNVNTPTEYWLNAGVVGSLSGRILGNHGLYGFMLTLDLFGLRPNPPVASNKGFRRVS